MPDETMPAKPATTTDVQKGKSQMNTNSSLARRHLKVKTNIKAGLKKDDDSKPVGK
jgi:hypothetical protein